jgi:acrosin
MNDAGQSLNSDVVIATFTVNAGGGFSVSDETDDGVTRNRVTPNTGQFIDVSVVTSLVGHGSTAGDTISVGFTNTAIGSLTVNADDGNDTVNVTGNSVGTTINGDNDNDTINVSSNAPTNTGNLNGIAASLTLNLGAGTAGGDQAIVVSDFGEATTANNNVGVTSTQVTGFAGAANGTTITYSAGAGADNTTMTLRGSDTLSDTFNVTSTSASFTSTTIQGNGGNDAMNVSSDAPTNNGNLDAILGGLSLDLGNGTGAQSIVVSDFSAAAGNTVTLTNSTITGLAPVTITYGTGTGGTDTLTLRGSNTQADTFNVQSTNGGFNNSTVQGNGGDDNANVGSNAGVNNNGNLDNIAGQLTISLGADGGGSQAIVVSDFSAAADNTNVVVTNGSITGFAPASINYSTAGTKGDSLTLRGSDTNADTFNVQSTNVSFTSNSIQGNGGNDAINVSSDAPTNDGNLDAILGGLSLDLGNGTGAQSIVVSDFSAGAGNTVTLTNTQITGLAPVIINYTTGTGGTDTLILRGSNTQNDTFNIKSSSAAFTNTTVQGNGGDDSINVGSNAGVNNNGNLDNVAGQLTLSLGTDGGGNQAIVISDFGAGADNTNVVVTSGSITGFATAPINYSTAGNNVDTITLRGSDTNADTFNVQSTSASFTSTTIQGNGGNDAINVSSDAPTNNGNLDNIAGVLSLNLGNGTGAQSIVVSDFSAATDNTSVVVTNASITGFATAQINYNTGIGGTDTLTLRGSDTNADTFNVRSTSASFTSTTIQGNGGNDAINVSSDAPTNNGNLDNIAGVLSLNLGNGTGAQSIVVSDFSAAAGNTVTLTNSTITGLAPVTITYGTGTGGTDTLTLRGSNTQVDTFNVTSSNAAFTNTTVQGNGGNDNINVSSDAPTNSGNLAGIAGKLTLDLGAGTGAQAIVVSNFGGAAGTTATLTNTSITGFAPAQIDYAATAGGGAVNSITLRGADGFADTFNVQSTSANFSATGVQGNGGTDTFNVASDAPANVGNLDGVLGILSIDGGAGANTLTVSDFSAAAGNGAVVINNANITGFAPVTINYAATGGAFSKITITGSNNAGVSENFTVNNPNGPLTLNANAGADTVNVQQISATANINGGDGNDIINVGNAGSMDTITAALTVVGGNQSDTINFNDAADVTNNTYTLTAVNLTRTGSSNVTFTTLEALTLNAGTGTNAINVTQTLATMPMTINGGTGNDTLTVPNTVNAWAINGTDTGTVNGTAITFNLGAGTNNVTGGSNSDTFTIGATGDISGTINGGSGTDTLNTSAFGGGVTFNLTSNNNGSTTGDNGLTFQSLESYVAGAGTDVFAFSNGVGVSGSINGGGGSDWLNYNAYLTAVVVNLSLNSATGVGGGVSNVENVIGGSGDDVLTGDGNANVLVGRGGNDRLIGNAGRDILIGGNGGDYMDGGDGEDIVVGGASTHENNITNLETDRSDWVANANPASAQMAAFLATVSNDGAVDRLRGGNQNDWFISSAGDILEDVTGGDVSSIV